MALDSFLRSYLTALFRPVFHSFPWLRFILPLGMDTNLLSNCCWNTERMSTLKTRWVIKGGAREVLALFFFFLFTPESLEDDQLNWLGYSHCMHTWRSTGWDSKPLDSAVLSCLRGGHDTLRSFCLNSRVLHLSGIIWPPFRSRKLLSPHLPPLVPVDGANFVTCCLPCCHSCRGFLS